jgi:hypothetical protein
MELFTEKRSGVSLSQAICILSLIYSKNLFHSKQINKYFFKTFPKYLKRVN